VSLLLVSLINLVAASGLPARSAGPLATTYYVRPDGGSAEQCTGRANAPYPGSGTAQPCAWDHPFRALPPGGAPRIAGGDTLRIGPGSYMMGYGAPETDVNCDAGGAFGCLMPPIPSGPSPANRTRILGDSQNPPELWGTERPWFIINLTDSSNVELGHLEITDHSGCVEFHSGGLACERENPPYGAWASYGLYAEDSANVYLHHLNIHGLAAGGVHAGRLADWTVADVRIAGNGSVGWDGDLWDDLGDSNVGTLSFRRFTVEWNGCGEIYPGGEPTGCWAQSVGGYGDGFATGLSGGHWIIEDSAVRYNTSDGLDFLYIREPDSSITIRRTLLEGNAGSQVKNDRGPFLIENSIIIGNCGFFDGQSFTYNVDNCRAMGDALDLGLMAGDHITVTNNTLTSEGDCLVGAECHDDVGCNGSERVTLRNNIFVGQVDFLQPFENTCLIYQETFPSDPFDMDYSVINNVKDGSCPGANHICGDSPGVFNAGVDTFDAHLLASSPARDAGLSSAAPPDDFDGDARDAQPDIGAYEYGAGPPPPTAMPTATPTGTSGPPLPTATFTRTPTATPTSPSGSAGIYLPLIVRAGGAAPTPTPTSTSTAMPTATPTATPTVTSAPGADNPNPPTSPVRLIFIHHSTGGNWLADPAENELGGDLGRALMNNNYFVSATNYGWGVGEDAIGDRTDIGNWWEWFRGSNSTAILAALYAENGQNFGDYGAWPRLAADPGGENQVIVFKSCFPNSALQGNANAVPPPITGNPLRGQDAYSDYHTVANAKGIYIDLLEYFRTRQDKLFVVITAPPLQDGAWATNARAFNNWLVNDWLSGYPYANVAVFDFYNVLTSNGGNPDINDLGWADGNHHRWWYGAVQHQQTVTSHTAAYPSGDDHPNRAGNTKATVEFVQLLNVFYHRWAGQ